MSVRLVIDMNLSVEGGPEGPYSPLPHRPAPRERLPFLFPSRRRKAKMR